MIFDFTNLGHIEQTIKGILFSLNLILPDIKLESEYQIMKNIHKDERVLMRSHPSYMISFEQTDFKSVLNEFSHQNGISREKFYDLQYLFKNFSKEEVSITEKSEYGLPVPVLVQKKNHSKILSKFIIF